VRLRQPAVPPIVQSMADTIASDQYEV
jgi:hypothetical protein